MQTPNTESDKKESSRVSPTPLQSRSKDVQQTGSYRTVSNEGVLTSEFTARFERGPNGEVGGYIVDSQTNSKFHISGTAPNGDYIYEHTIRNGQREPHRGDQPKLYIRTTAEILDMLELTPLPGKPDTYHRKGFIGAYTLQRESDGSVSVFFAGGHHQKNIVLPPQTFHHGRWDTSRNVRRTQITEERERARESNQEIARKVATRIQAGVNEKREHVSEAGVDSSSGGSGFYSEHAAVTKHSRPGVTETWREHRETHFAECGKLEFPVGNALSQIDQRREATVPVALDHKTTNGQTETGYAFPRSYSGTKGILYLADRPNVLPELVSLTLRTARGADSSLNTQVWHEILTADRVRHRVMLRPDGSVLEHDKKNNSFVLHVPILEAGKSTALEWQTRQMQKGGPQEPDFVETRESKKQRETSVRKESAAVQSQPDELQGLRKRLREEAGILADEILAANALSGNYPSLKLTVPGDLELRNKVTEPFSLEKGRERFYIFPRRFRDSKSKADVSGIMLIRDKDLLSSATPPARLYIESAYRHLRQGGKIEEWLTTNDGDVSLRSDGSIVHRKSKGAEQGTILRPLFTGDKGTLTWSAIDAEIRADGRYYPKEKK